jgi:hypothetical protein
MNLEQIRHAQQQQAAGQLATGEQALPGALEHLANALGEGVNFNELQHLSAEQLGRLHSSILE